MDRIRTTPEKISRSWALYFSVGYEKSVTNCGEEKSIALREYYNSA